MIWVFITCIIVFIIGMILTILYFDTDLPDWVFFVSLSLVVISGVTFITLAILTQFKDNKTKPIEYPASEYSLEIKVTEFQGNKDTTYVLIPKQ